MKCRLKAGRGGWPASSVQSAQSIPLGYRSLYASSKSCVVLRAQMTKPLATICDRELCSHDSPKAPRIGHEPKPIRFTQTSICIVPESCNTLVDARSHHDKSAISFGQRGSRPLLVLQSAPCRRLHRPLQFCFGPNSHRYTTSVGSLRALLRGLAACRCARR